MTTTGRRIYCEPLVLAANLSNPVIREQLGSPLPIGRVIEALFCPCEVAIKNVQEGLRGIYVLISEFPINPQATSPPFPLRSHHLVIVTAADCSMSATS